MISHNNKTCEATLSEGWCETWHHKRLVHSSLRFWISGCRSQCNGCMNVAWALIWGGSRSTTPCVFPCKVAAVGDERYLVCAAGAAGVVSSSNWFLLCVLQRVVVHVCAVLCVCCICGCRSHCNGCMNIAWGVCWGKAGA